MLLNAALGDRTAAPIVAAFFSVFFQYWGDTASKEDEKIMAMLRREIDAVVVERNRLMHDALLGQSVGGEPVIHAMARLRTRAHGKGVNFESVDITPDYLMDFALKIERLRRIVYSINFYHRPGQIGPAVYQRFEIINGKVVERVVV